MRASLAAAAVTLGDVPPVRLFVPSDSGPASVARSPWNFASQSPGGPLTLTPLLPIAACARSAVCTAVAVALGAIVPVATPSYASVNVPPLGLPVTVMRCWPYSGSWSR
jgi:hypothetical protein